MSYLGIDIGSSQVKAVAFDPSGKIMASAYRKYAFAVPEPGAAELDSREVLQGCFEVIAEVAAQTPVRALAVSSQGEAFTPVDANGEILAPAMISGDTRATGVIDEFAEKYGHEFIYRITGHTPSGMFSLAKLLWLKKYRPEIRRRAAKFLCFEDLLVHALTGIPAMGYSIAGRTMLFDINTRQWSSELLAAAGFNAGEFAVPYPSGTIVGPVKSELARKLNLSPDTKVVTGGHDQVIGALGCGAYRPGSAMYACGSVECIVPVVDRKILTPELCRNHLCTYDFPLPGLYASLAYSLTGSNFLEYFIHEFARDLSGDYTALLDTMPTEPTSILTIPYFTLSGTPYFDAETPGVVHGWRLQTPRGTLLKGIQEGIALEMKLNLELLHQNGFTIRNFIATGGGFRHPGMVQLRADILNLPLQVIDQKEAGCLSAALLAQHAAEGTPLADFPAPKAIATATPDPAKAALYEEKFTKWKNLSQKIRAH